MAAVHVIPCLDVQGGRVVKGVNFVDLADKGDPVTLARRYAQQGADELVFLDISATVEERGTTVSMVARIAEQLQIPFTVGGGVRTVADAGRLLDAGATKVGVNSAALTNPQLIADIAERYGSEHLVSAIDVAPDAQQPSGYTVVTHGGKRSANRCALEWALTAAELGAGSLLVTAMGADGTQEGYDLSITGLLASNVNIPVIASGGAGKLEHFAPAAEVGARGVLAASVFHDGTLTVTQVKESLAQAGFEVNT